MLEADTNTFSIQRCTKLFDFAYVSSRAHLIICQAVSFLINANRFAFLSLHRERSATVARNLACAHLIILLLTIGHYSSFLTAKSTLICKHLFKILRSHTIVRKVWIDDTNVSIEVRHEHVNLKSNSNSIIFVYPRIHVMRPHDFHVTRFPNDTLVADSSSHLNTTSFLASFVFDSVSEILTKTRSLIERIGGHQVHMFGVSETFWIPKHVYLMPTYSLNKTACFC